MEINEIPFGAKGTQMLINNSISKAYEEGVYGDTPANRKLGRVGQRYSGEKKVEEKKEEPKKELTLEEHKKEDEKYTKLAEEIINRDDYEEGKNKKLDKLFSEYASKAQYHHSAILTLEYKKIDSLIKYKKYNIESKYNEGSYKLHDMKYIGRDYAGYHKFEGMIDGKRDHISFSREDLRKNHIIEEVKEEPKKENDIQSRVADLYFKELNKEKKRRL